jgi:hypothetical protein
MLSFLNSVHPVAHLLRVSIGTSSIQARQVTPFGCITVSTLPDDVSLQQGRLLEFSQCITLSQYDVLALSLTPKQSPVLNYPLKKISSRPPALNFRPCGATRQCCSFSAAPSRRYRLLPSDHAMSAGFVLAVIGARKGISMVAWSR